MQDFAHALMVLLSPVERLRGEVVTSKDTLLKEQRHTATWRRTLLQAVGGYSAGG